MRPFILEQLFTVADIRRNIYDEWKNEDHADADDYDFETYLPESNIFSRNPLVFVQPIWWRSIIEEL